MIKLFLIVFLVKILVENAASVETYLTRQKRFLIVPPTSPTRSVAYSFLLLFYSLFTKFLHRHQWVGGIGIPLDLDFESITLGWVFKAQYFLPDRVNHLKLTYFPGFFANYTPTDYLQQQKFPNSIWEGRKKREITVDKITGQTFEKYEGEVKEVGNEEIPEENEIDQNDDYFEDQFENPNLTKENFMAPEDTEYDLMGSRWVTYDGLARVLESKGLNGRICVLRGICDLAETQFSHDRGLLEELLHIVFTPSTTNEAIVNPMHYDYMKAEALGRSGEPCDQIFKECKKSLLEIFTQVHDNKMFDFKY